jgi:aldose sugar dehydrogenase
MRRAVIHTLALAFLVASCTNADANAGDAVVTDPGEVFQITTVANFDRPWAMTFLPDGRLLVTEKPGSLKLVELEGGEVTEVTGVPSVAYGGQGGFGDVVLHPEFAESSRVYISFAEAGEGGRGAAVARATFRESDGAASLDDVEVIWRQSPKVSGEGHYAHRMAFGDGMLFITSGDRQKLDPAQDLQQTLGKIVRLHDDGRVPSDNPFASEGGVAAEVWTLGHRNPLGIAFDTGGRLWAHEMGPRGGDELNLVERGNNYGWPEVSEGIHYDMRDIPDHDTRPEFTPPVASWTPVISPSGFIFYGGDLFVRYRGNGFFGGLSSEALIRVQFDGTKAREVERFPMGTRIREVEEGPDGALYLLEDGGNGRLMRLAPKP